MLAVEIADIELELVAAGGNAGETDDAVRRGAAHDVEHDRAGAGAFDHDVGLERAEIADVVGGAERAHQSGLMPSSHAVEHVHFKPALHADQRRQQADRPAPVTSATRGCQAAPRAPIRITCSQALATTLVGSSRTPSMFKRGIDA